MYFLKYVTESVVYYKEVILNYLYDYYNAIGTNKQKQIEWKIVNTKEVNNRLPTPIYKQIEYPTTYNYSRYHINDNPFSTSNYQ